MKANELMIGDWVRIEHYKYEYLNCIGQIAGINEREGSIEPRTFNVIYEKDGKKGLNVGVSKRNVFPVPITKEILEKNGFMDDGASWWYRDFHISLSGTKNLTLICGRTIQFSFVHELQHALRLCGLEELADNFKVE